MGMAGWDSSKQLAALDSVVALAAAGNLDLGIASDIVTKQLVG